MAYFCEAKGFQSNGPFLKVLIYPYILIPCFKAWTGDIHITITDNFTLTKHFFQMWTEMRGILRGRTPSARLRTSVRINTTTVTYIQRIVRTNLMDLSVPARKDTDGQRSKLCCDKLFL